MFAKYRSLMSQAGIIYDDSKKRTPYKGIPLDSVPSDIQSAWRSYVDGTLNPTTVLTALVEFRTYGYISEEKVWFERAMESYSRSNPMEGISWDQEHDSEEEEEEIVDEEEEVDE
jgi:hypothetical protein